MASKTKNLKKTAGSRVSHEPRPIGSIIDEMLQKWNRNTELCVDLKTILHSDRIVQRGKQYTGILSRIVPDEEFAYDDLYMFVEDQPQTARKRNPHVFFGRYVTVTRWADGSLHPNLRPMLFGENFNTDSYAIGVCNELRQALSGLVGKE